MWPTNGMGAARYAAGVDSDKARAALAEIITPEDVARAAWYLGVEAIKTCPRRSKSDPPCRSNIDPGMVTGRVTASCG